MQVQFYTADKWIKVTPCLLDSNLNFINILHTMYCRTKLSTSFVFTLLLGILHLQVFERTNSSQAQYSRQPRVTFGTQTDFRESETQTIPCSLNNTPMKGELGALSMLKYGRGLPVQTDEDLVYVDKLRENYEKERNLPPKGKHYFIRCFRQTGLMFFGKCQFIILT